LSSDYLDNVEVIKGIVQFGEPVNIIQHPKGRRKEVVLSNNWVNEIKRDHIWYAADADYSSSGSPVFNQQWQLVALHHAAVGHVEKDPEKEGGYVIIPNEKTGDFNISNEEGVRVCKIVKHLSGPQLTSLRASSLSKAQKLKKFILEFVEIQDPEILSSLNKEKEGENEEDRLETSEPALSKPPLLSK